MICYLWFSNNLGAPKSSPRYRGARQPRRPTVPSAKGSPTDPLQGLSDESSAALQFMPSVPFVSFMQKLLQTTQVSQSVIVLSLHYIYRLKEENFFRNGKPGSEFRVAVVALMLANKFIDDNTYTNKTWSDVSGIELPEINKMEREFLQGVDFRLYVNTDTYKAWVNLLKGLVAVKERDEQQWLYSRHRRHNGIIAPVPRSVHSADSSPHHQPRARSSSPLPSLKAAYPFTFAVPAFTNPISSSASSLHLNRQHPPINTNGTKRPAMIAFSPPSAHDAPPAKRPISLDMSVVRPIEGPRSAGYPLSAFSKLSLVNKPESTTRGTPLKPKVQPMVDNSQHTLAAAYTLQDRVVGQDPQHLYYYTLASSPAHPDGHNRERKAVLRSHQPPTYYPPPPRYSLQPPPQPMYIQSANPSPLPSFRYLQARRYSHGRPYYFTSSNPPNHQFTNESVALPPIRVLDENLPPPPPREEMYSPAQSGSPAVPVAPFANAGPPGVYWMSHHSSSPSHGYSHMRYALLPQI